MSIVLEKLKDEKRPCKAEYLGAEINFAYYCNRLTIERDERLAEERSVIKAAAKKLEGAKPKEGEPAGDMSGEEAINWVTDYIKEFVAEWDVRLQEKDKLFAPIDDSVLKRLPGGLLGAMVTAIITDQHPDPKKPAS